MNIKESDKQEKSCNDIKDPVRRSLCKVCNMPVVGRVPFCKEYEPPVP